MLLHADFTHRAIVTPDQQQWVASPQAGVERVMLDRVGEEKARATSLVRYAPDSHFPPHLHPGGEEIFVLSGTFSDEHGDYPAGWYLRNPPGSSHQPFSEPGSTIFVKLWQMPSSDSTTVRIDTRDPAYWQPQPDSPDPQSPHGREVCPLFTCDTEQVCLQRLAPGQTVFAAAANSAELLVLSGSVVMDDHTYERGSWIRLPEGDPPHIAAHAQGATVYLKTGHLAPTSLATLTMPTPQASPTTSTTLAQ